MSIRRQCELLELNRSSVYYDPVDDEPLNLTLMRRIDELYTATPFYGSRRITVCLEREGYTVNRKRVQRLMRRMGIEAVYPKPRTTRVDEQHEKYPYLLRDIAIQRPDHAWATDITYIRLRTGFIYLMAIIDWYSRYVLWIVPPPKRAKCGRTRLRRRKSAVRTRKMVPSPRRYTTTSPAVRARKLPHERRRFRR